MVRAALILTVVCAGAGFASGRRTSHIFSVLAAPLGASPYKAAFGMTSARELIEPSLKKICDAAAGRKHVKLRHEAKVSLLPTRVCFTAMPVRPQPLVHLVADLGQLPPGVAQQAR